MSNLEQYETLNHESSERKISYGSYSQLVAAKHIHSYGEDSQLNIRNAVHRIFVTAMDQFENSTKNNNLLLVGKVQSGKTSNLEALTALAFDNGFNLMIIYGGYDKFLLKQTTERFKKTFNVSDDTDDIFDNSSPAVFTTGKDGLSIDDIDEEIYEELFEANVPIILTAMKRPQGLMSVNKFLQRVDSTKIKCFVIDDEGDQASLNISKDKKHEASATYAKICDMKRLLKNPLYFSVTATPHANIFLDSLSELRPDDIRLLHPGKDYCGAESFRPDTPLIEPIADDMEDSIEANIMPSTLKKALMYYLVASAVMNSRNLSKSDMIIHAFREQRYHETIFNWVDQFMSQLKYLYSNNDEPGKRAFLTECKKTYHSEFSKELQASIQFEELEKHFRKVVTGTHVVLQNAKGSSTQGKAAIKRNIIYVGGDLLQRGLTFKKLVTTYFTRWPKDGGNMDTNLQRARWFGYRAEYIDLCKVFTTSEISDELFALAGVEEDLWDQFEEIESGTKGVRDVIIEAESTQQRPTRRQAADYKTVKFRSSWIKQKIGVFDKNIINSNNKKVDELLAGLHFTNGYFGSPDEMHTTCSFASASATSVINMLKSQYGIYDELTFRFRDIERVIEDDEVLVIKMRFFDKGRKRTFYSFPSGMYNRIKALHQGPDRVQTEGRKYNGDKFVIVDRSKINLQIFKIIPEHDGRNRPDETQYMFALYVPGDKTYFTPIKES